MLKALRFVVVGHAVLEQARQPWPGITCKALFVPVDEACLRLPRQPLLARLDQAKLANPFTTPSFGKIAAPVIFANN